MQLGRAVRSILWAVLWGPNPFEKSGTDVSGQPITMWSETLIAKLTDGLLMDLLDLHACLHVAQSMSGIVPVNKSFASIDLLDDLSGA